ncbi:MAG: MNIO family bufferin maturase [Steroidobacter sp.]
MSGHLASPAPATLPPRAGVGLKPVHYRSIIETRPDIGFFEVHAENYMGPGGPPHRFLEAIRADYPLSVHGVGLSIGASQALDRQHLERLKRVVARYEPGLVSEHLAWSTHDGVFLNDLLPLPYTQRTLACVCAHVDEVQGALRRPILLENPSTYVRFVESSFAETEFLAEVAARTGCGLLLDVNNVMVSATNHGTSPQAYIDAFPIGEVQEIHLAGFSEEPGQGDARILIDDHGSVVHPDVWSLYELALSRCGAAPTLIEWDNNVPEFSVLLEEAQRAQLALRDVTKRSTVQGSADGAQLG